MKFAANSVKKNGHEAAFFHPAIDGMAMFGLTAVVACLVAMSGETARTTEIIAIGSFLVWIVNWPHFSATSYRLYHSDENRSQYPITAYAVPIILSLVAFAAFQSPLMIAPIVVKIFALWSPYHFSGQTLGLSTLYARRSGYTFSKSERFWLAALIFSTFLTSTIFLETRSSGFIFHGIRYMTFGLPEWTLTVARIWMAATTLIFVIVHFRARQLNGQAPHWLCYTPVLAQIIWFVPGREVASFREFVPALHSFQYLFIALVFQLGDTRLKEARADEVPQNRQKIHPLRRSVVPKLALWYGLNVIGGTLLFFILPRASQVLTGRSIEFGAGILIALGQIHHFFVDGVIWRLRNHTSRSPLMMSFEELTQSSKPIFGSFQFQPSVASARSLNLTRPFRLAHEPEEAGRS